MSSFKFAVILATCNGLYA